MRTTRYAVIASVLSSLLIAGCGDKEEARPVDLTKSTDTAQFKGMLGDQMEKAKIKAKPGAMPSNP